MSVPIKTGMQWLEDYNKITSKSELALFLNKKWVLLEDHQKEIFYKLRKEYLDGGLTIIQYNRLKKLFGVGGAKPK